MDDPSLTPTANALLADELRRVLGDDAPLPSGRPAPAPPRHPWLGAIWSNRMLLVVTFLAALVVGAIIAIATRSWWAVVGAVAVHALGTLAVAAGAIRMTTVTEHVAPETAARLQDEGVRDPDRTLAELVERARGDSRRGLRETLSNRFDEQTVAPEDDPARATVEQETTMTPTSRPGRAAGIGVGADGPGGLPPGRTLVAIAASIVVATAAFMVVVGFIVGAL